MATEILVIPEEHLQEVINVLLEGMKTVTLTAEAREALENWIADEERYLHNAEDTVP